ncbi:hypothetical protein ACFFTN_04580 [Aminobacter aganoensis]|uniref:Putative glyoxalase superfamily protein PhnB n=1 Tax=Aminobacter aganoensis TaxID=83264 RepID=A0A7X0KKR3_9HYPH|nr:MULTISPECIES: hypothetical protein [Aminobacter]MBB6354269.1 putative glyoxalase superfamily protein PhnB [Aminobacter aganoensis]
MKFVNHPFSNGNCREAFGFYAKVFDGEIVGNADASRNALDDQPRQCRRIGGANAISRGKHDLSSH